MPDKPLTVITYAASASLAAIALVYFFNPNYLIDGDPSTSSASTRKKGIVGLSNPANDCFINSVLQSLAGLGELRLYLIRELHRRKVNGSEIYASVPEDVPNEKPINIHKLRSLQSGEVTQGLKDMIDGLNERPIYKKTISARNFIEVLEHAFGTRISKSQQDAQELLQIVAERLSEEYHAGKEARKRASNIPDLDGKDLEDLPPGLGLSIERTNPEDELDLSSGPEMKVIPEETTNLVLEEESGFPLEGQTESQIECQFCHFIPKANPVSFVMLTLAVPQQSSTTLSECFDAHFKTEYIDDYKCDKCRLEHAQIVFAKELAKARSEAQRQATQEKIIKVQRAIEENPEQPPKDVDLPDIKLAPERRIARHVQITTFPKILVIHLSRSIFDPSNRSTKNAAKVSFPESLPLGGLLSRRNYKLLGLVSHKGTHNSGHYESFRRQHLYAPYSTPHSRNESGPYSALTTPNPSTLPSPRDSAAPNPNATETSNSRSGSDGKSLVTPSIMSLSPSTTPPSVSPSSTRPSSGSIDEGVLPKKPPTSVPSNQLEEAFARNSIDPDDRPDLKKSSHKSSLEIHRLKRKKKPNDRWWRISDDKIKECKTSEVLGMQREVYMLFYEMEKS